MTENDTKINAPQPKGVEAVKALLEAIPSLPGVYRMLAADGRVLYIGKARNLKKRVASYAQRDNQGIRIQRMVAQIANIEVTTTANEAEALLLEANLVKHQQPHYNILLKDDKSFPYIVIDDAHDFPRIALHRGERKRSATYFGPFASGYDVREAIAAIQKSFLIRPCADTIFASRTRPCMEYQIKRCSAPCVGKVDKEEYAWLLGQAKSYLSGKTREVQDQLARGMEEASATYEYEKAAILRDRIHALTRIQSRQHLYNWMVEDADAIGLAQDGSIACVQVFFFRGGQALGNKAFFPVHTEEASASEILEAFIGRFYQGVEPPKLVLVSHALDNAAVVEEALGIIAERKVEVMFPQKGEKKKLMETVVSNAQMSLDRKRRESASTDMLLEGVEKLFGLEAPPKRIEVYDNSHIMGKHATGGMIVAGPEGFTKNAYRKFNVDPASLTGGDDFAMMREVLQRRFGRLKREHPDQDQTWPDLVLIDGGAAHMQVVKAVFDDLAVTVPFACIAKGPDRNAGREVFHMPGREPFQLEPQDPVLYYLQRLRDEAHRFAIFTHRAKRSRAIKRSELDVITGIGPVRKKALLHHFGSVSAIKEASLKEIENVPRLGKKAALEIYRQFHS